MNASEAFEMAKSIYDLTDSTKELTESFKEFIDEPNADNFAQFGWDALGTGLDAYESYKTVKILFPTQVDKAALAIKAGLLKIASAVKYIGLGKLALYGGEALVLGLAAYGLYNSATAETEEEKSEKRVQAYDNKLNEKTSAYTEHKTNSVYDVYPLVSSLQEMPGLLNELKTYLDDDGNIISNKKRAQKIFDSLQQAIPNAFKQDEEGKITFKDAEKQLNDVILEATGALLLESEKANYEKAQQTMLELMDEKTRIENEIEAKKNARDKMIESLADKMRKNPNGNFTVEIDQVNQSKDNLNREIEELEKKLFLIPEKLERITTDLDNYNQLKFANKTGDPELLEKAVGAYLQALIPSAGEDNFNKAFKLSGIFDDVKNLGSVLQQLQASGARADTQMEMVTKILSQMDSIRQEMLQNGFDKDKVNNLFASAMREINKTAPQYTQQAGELFGEQVKNAYDMMQSAIGMANEAIIQIQMKIDEKSGNVHNQDIIARLSEQGLLATDLESIAGNIEKMKELAAQAGVNIDTEILAKTEEAIRIAEEYATGKLESILNDFKTAVENNFGSASAIGETLIAQLMSGAKKEGEINSPSKLMAREVGLPLAQGIGVGFQKGMKQFAGEASLGMLSSLGEYPSAFTDQQMAAVRAAAKDESLQTAIEAARASVLAFRQDPFGGARPEITGGSYAYSGSSSTYSPSYTFNSPKALDYREMRQELRRMDQLNRLMARS